MRNSVPIAVGSRMRNEKVSVLRTVLGVAVGI